MSYFNHIYSASPDELPHRAMVVYIYLRDRAGLIEKVNRIA